MRRIRGRYPRPRHPRHHAPVHLPEIEPLATGVFRDGRELSLTCRLPPEIKRQADYVLVPFEAPAGTARLEVQYAYGGQQGHSEIDLGLVDPRGAEFPRFPGFRGWSGTARERAVVTAQAATPGYLPGPIQPGRWWVLLGLYRIESGAVEVTLTIRMSPTPGELPAPLPGPAALAAPPAGPPRWLPGDLHSHTDHSDAPGSLEELVDAARRRGLEFLAVTDHNTTSHFPYLQGERELTLLAGEEVTTYYGHMNAWGHKTPLDFRVRRASELRAVIDAAHAQGAIVGACHPTIAGMGWNFGYELPLDCLEVWHANSGPLNSVTLEMWDGMLSAGRRVIAVGGSDTHIGKPHTPLPGEPTTWIRAGSPAHLLEGLRRGRVVVTAHDGPWLELQATDGVRTWQVGDDAPPGPLIVRCVVERGAGSSVRLISSQSELVAAEVDREHFELELPVDLGQARLVRAELIKKGNASWQEAFPFLALTNPIWAAREDSA